MTTQVLTDLSVLDDVLGAHRDALGADFEGYRNHAYRMANFCAVLAGARGEAVTKIALAAACHDLGIWTAGTFDYLCPSVQLARAHLARNGPQEWTGEIETMIDQHHKLTPCRGHGDALVEPFRKADLADVSCGVVSFGLPHDFRRAVFARWPGAGFRGRLVQLAFDRLKTHPLSPLPMLKW